MTSQYPHSLSLHFYACLSHFLPTMSAFTALSGIIVLTRARALAPEKGSRSILLDASVYASDDHDECPSLGLVHYFNDENIDFNDDDPKPVNAIIHVSVFNDPLLPTLIFPPQFAITPASLNPQLLPPTFNNHDYAFIGDIAHVRFPILYLLGLTIVHQLSVLPETCVTERLPYVIATGTVSSTPTPDSRSFTLTSDEYVSIIHGTATCTLSCTFPSTPRWANTAIPRQNTVMTIGGTLHETIRATNGSVSSFGIMIEAISFTPRQLPHQTSPTRKSFTSNKHHLSLTYLHI